MRLFVAVDLGEEVPEETLEPLKKALLRGAATSAPFAIEWRGGGCFGGKKPRGSSYTPLCRVALSPRSSA